MWLAGRGDLDQHAGVPPAPLLPEPPTPRTLLVEDNADLAFGLQRTLEANGHEVTVAANGADALRAARTLHPDLIILDLMIPLVDGYGVLAQLRADGLQMPVLILSARGEEADKVRGLRTGADDFVTKPFGVLELLARAQALLRRAATAPAAPVPGPVRMGDCVVDAAARRVTRAGDDVALTPKELDLLLALVQHPGQAMPRTTLLRDVWGHAPDIQTRTVDIHIAELRRKLEHDPSQPRHLVTVWKTGYRFDP